jgi:ubiquinol-cytochrome c reductase cytochrome b subunit
VWNRSKKRPNFYHHLHPPTIPVREASFYYTFGLGGIAVYLSIILAITGVLVLFYYIPTADKANSSLQEITFLIPYGRLIRSLHFWSGQSLVIVTILHMLRIVLTGSYKIPRRLNWLLGIGLLATVLFLNFTGYGLRWDMDIAWALLVGTNLIKTIPLIGPELYRIIVGGSELTGSTILRFYSWHIYFLPIVSGILLAWHIFRVRRDGGISTSATKSPQKMRIKREELVQREVIAILVTSIVLLIISTIFPPNLGPSANFNDLPPEAEAPWFFLWVQELLRLGPPFLMGVLVPFILLMILILLPYLIDRSVEGVGDWFNSHGRAAQWIVISILAFVLVFTILGAIR